MKKDRFFSESSGGEKVEVDPDRAHLEDRSGTAEMGSRCFCGCVVGKMGHEIEEDSDWGGVACLSRKEGITYGGQVILASDLETGITDGRSRNLKSTSERQKIGCGKFSS